MRTKPTPEQNARWVADHRARQRSNGIVELRVPVPRTELDRLKMVIRAELAKLLGPQ